MCEINLVELTCVQLFEVYFNCSNEMLQIREGRMSMCQYEDKRS